VKIYRAVVFGFVGKWIYLDTSRAFQGKPDLFSDGLICYSLPNSGDDYDEADLSYNLGAGLRWDAMDYLFVKAVYRFMWTKMDNHDTRILLDGLSLGIGYMY